MTQWSVSAASVLSLFQDQGPSQWDPLLNRSRCQGPHGTTRLHEAGIFTEIRGAERTYSGCWAAGKLADVISSQQGPRPVTFSSCVYRYQSIMQSWRETVVLLTLRMIKRGRRRVLSPVALSPVILSLVSLGLMGKPVKSFQEGETPPFKTSAEPPSSGRGRGRVCKNPTSPEKNHLRVPSVSVSPTRTIRNGRDQLSRGSSEISDEPPSSERIHRVKAQKSLTGLNSALSHHVKQFKDPGTLMINVDDYQPSGSAVSAHHPVSHPEGSPKPPPEACPRRHNCIVPHHTLAIKIADKIMNSPVLCFPPSVKAWAKLLQ